MTYVRQSLGCRAMFLFLLVQEVVIDRCSPKSYCSRNSSYEMPIRLDRCLQDDVNWERKYVFICKIPMVDRNELLTLNCDRNLSCDMKRCWTASEEWLKSTAAVDVLPSLDDLTVYCPNVMVSSLAVDGLVVFRGQHVLSPTAITALQMSNVGVTSLPSGYVCHPTNETVPRFRQGCHEPRCCACGLTRLDLRRNGLRVVGRDAFPCDFPELTSLDLSSNAIATVDAGAFVKLTRLRTLSLGQNFLKVLPVTVFDPLVNLEMLDLQKNVLTEDVVQSLKSLTKLRELNLAVNDVRHWNRSNQLRSLAELTTLKLNCNRLETLPSRLQSSRSLRYLDVSNNAIVNVSATAFDAMPQLVEVDLSFNSLQSVPRNFFVRNGHFRKLHLRFNQITSFPRFDQAVSIGFLDLASNRLGNITSEDKESFCHLVNLEYLNLDGNSIGTITDNAFECNTRLSRLHLGNNDLSEVSMDDLPPLLQKLNLAHNRLQEWHGPTNPGKNGSGPPLQILILANNQISTMTNDSLPPTLQRLNLGSNKIRQIPFTGRSFTGLDLTWNLIGMACPLQLGWVTLRHVINPVAYNPLLCPCEQFWYESRTSSDPGPYAYSQVRKHHGACPQAIRSSVQLDVQKLLDGRYEFTCGANISGFVAMCQCNLYSAYAAQCALQCPEPCTCFLDRKFTTYLVNCSHRNLSDVPQMPSVHGVCLVSYFFGNRLERLRSHALASYSTSKELYLNRNGMRVIDGDAFCNLSSLEILNLQNNLLVELPPELFMGFGNLKELYLNNNHLAFLSDDTFTTFPGLNSLSTLDLRSNLLTNFSVWQLGHLQSLTSIRLSGNPWSCDCEYIQEFQNWLQNLSHLVDDASDLQCLTNNHSASSTIPILTFNSPLCQASATSFPLDSSTTVWVSIVSVATFAIVVAVLVFVHRREVQIIVYSRYGLRLFHRNREDDEGKVYDAFLAYSSRDEEFVVYNLVPGLENIERPYRLCIHERDFLPGANIIDGILEAIEKSRRTIIVLSQNFVDSGFCRFEFKSAHLQMISDRCNRVIVILLGEVPQDVDLEMRLYLKTYTYLKWGSNLFWKRLYYALPNRTSVADTTL